MKISRTLAIMGIILTICTAHLDAQNNMFDRLANNKDITTVFISKALLNMMPSDMDMGGANIKNLANKLEQIEIYTTQTKDAVTAVQSEITTLAKDKKYTNLMTIKETGSHITFYAQQDKEKFKDMIMVVNNTGETVIIRMIGSFTSDDIKGVMNSSNKGK